MTKYIISFLSLLVAAQASAFTERITLNEYDLRAAHNPGGVIELKRAIHQKYPHLRLSDFKLNDVHMEVAARHRGAVEPEVELLVNSKSVDRERVYAYGRHGRDRVWLNNHFGDLCGTWKIIMRGAVRPLEVQVTLHELTRWERDEQRRCRPDVGRDDRRPPRRPPVRPRPPRRPPKAHYQMVHLGTEKIEKFSEERVRFNLAGERTYEIRISTTSSDVDVLEAYAVTVRGEVIDLYELTGRLDENRSASVYLRGESLDRVEFRANSVSLLGSRARMSVEAGVRR